MAESSTRLRDFAARLLEHEGALIDFIEPHGLEVVAPENLAAKLRINELSRFEFAAELPAQAERVGLESDWLERFGGIIGNRGRHGRCTLNVPLPLLSNVERIVEHTVALQNAVYRVTDVRQAWTRYLIFLFRVTAYSDERRDGILKLGFNTANGSALDSFVERLFAAGLESISTLIGSDEAVTPPDAQLPARWTRAQIETRLKRALPSRVEMHFDSFLGGMRRRLERDLTRLYDYYNGLRDESLANLRKEKADTINRERLRLEAIHRDYQSKVADLAQKYAVRTEIELIQTLEITMPVQRVSLLIKRRKGERTIILDWNPLARRLDTPPCEYSYTSDTARLVCDDKLHLVSPAAHAPCARCGKAYCRACHERQCPKCA